ncbi:unnamed protein product [Adineta steineri]|uniref:Uncharacterized protein n=1 Tax=Adineta steineri TaxID=433720 RepID=A0A815QPT9_9BILA|nr:unnamed protein product [Adineta steineri]CAF4089832.1 unnamed protein product [Adineta steineri]
MLHHEGRIENEGLKDQSANQDEELYQWGNLKRTLNDKEILSQALTFMVAGYETTSALISFFFYIMATHQKVQKKLYIEIRQELGEDEITYEKINQLSYLDMVISETLRLYPPFIRFDRVASAPYELGIYHLPKGSVISVPVYPIHHDPITWPNPEEFIPERFLPTEKAKRHPMTYLPFGYGPRNCIAMRFALLKTKVAIVKTPLQLGKLAILASKTGIWLRATRRSQ